MSSAKADAVKAEELKVQGNELYQSGDYLGAEKKYSQAILSNSTNAILYTNRALARLRLEMWEEVVRDCERGLELLPNSMKAYYYRGQALLGLDRPKEALTDCQKAYELALEQKSRSAGAIAQTILQAKKKKWERLDQRRVHRESELLTDLKQLIQGDAERKILSLRDHSSFSSSMSDWNLNDEIGHIRQHEKERIDSLEEIFARAVPDSYGHREIPDYLIDNISFNVMTDPVVTKHGQSYERSSILDHLRRNKTDPLTREPLHEEDLRPNLNLKEACNKFLEENGWAVDY